MSLFASLASDQDLWAADSGGDLFQNPLQELLETDNFSLEDVLGQQTLIQELRNMNEMLVNYLETKVPELLALSGGDSDSADLASEVFACDVSQINDLLLSEENMKAIFSLLEKDSFPPRTAGNFAKLATVLINQERQRVLAWLKGQPESLKNFVRHIHSDSVSGALRQLLDLVDGDMHDEDDEPEGEEAAAPVGPPLWDPEVVVSALVSVFADDAVPKTAHTNAAETLMDAVARSSYQPPQPTSFGGWNTSIDQEAEQQQKVPKTPMMEVLLKSQAGALIKALPNRGSFHILTRILEFSIDAKERGDEQDTTAFVDEIQSNLGSVFPTLDSAPGLSVVMTTYGKRAPTFGIERLLALELVAALSAARPTVLSDDQMVVLFGFIARFPTHSILHSVVTNLILDRGAIPGGIRRAIVEWYDQAQESVPLEVAYGGHYLQIAVALNLEHERVAETKVRWEKELGEGNSLLHTQNAGAVSGGPELEYTFGDDSSSGEDDDDDDDDEIDADLLRARYGFAPAAELGAGLGDNSNSTDGADANPGGIEAGSEDKGVSDSNSEDAASNNEKTENFAAFETGAQDQAEVVWDAFNNGEAGNDAQENTFATFEAFGEDSTVKAGEDDAPRME